jgi:hypothetical protein
MGMDAEIGSASDRLISDVSVAVPEIGPRHSIANHLAAEILTIGSTQTNGSPIAVGAYTFASDRAAFHKFQEMLGSHSAGGPVAATLVRLRDLNSKEPPSRSSQLDRISIDDRLSGRRRAGHSSGE